MSNSTLFRIDVNINAFLPILTILGLLFCFCVIKYISYCHDENIYLQNEESNQNNYFLENKNKNLESEIRNIDEETDDPPSYKEVIGDI